MTSAKHEVRAVATITGDKFFDRLRRKFRKIYSQAKGSKLPSGELRPLSLRSTSPAPHIAAKQLNPQETVQEFPGGSLFHYSLITLPNPQAGQFFLSPVPTQDSHLFPKLNGTRSQSSLLHPGMSGETALYAKKYVNGMIIATG